MKKFLFFIVLIVLFGFSYEVNALENFTLCNSNVCSVSVSGSGNVITNFDFARFTPNESGLITGNFVYNSSQEVLYQMRIYNGSTAYVCDIDSTTYPLQGNYFVRATFSCPVVSGKSSNKFELTTQHLSGDYGIRFGKWITLTPYSTLNNGSTADYTEILNTLNNNITNLNTVIITEWRWTIPLMSQNISDIKSILSSQNSNINSINDSIKEQTQQQHEDSQKEQEAINNVNDTLNDSSTDSPDSSFNDYNDKLAKNGVITNLITLPIQLFTNVLNSINGTCKTFKLGNLMGTDLTLPCINISNYLGKDLWNVIDILFSGLFVLVIARKMIKVFENFSSMREGDVLGD